MYDYVNEHYESLEDRQWWADKHDTGKDGTVVEYGTPEHNNRSYKICVMKAG